MSIQRYFQLVSLGAQWIIDGWPVAYLRVTHGRTLKSISGLQRKGKEVVHEISRFPERANGFLNCIQAHLKRSTTCLL